MKTRLLLCFLLFTTLIFGKNEKDIIKEIDDINSSALVLYKNSDIVKSFKEFIKAKTLSDSIQDIYGSAFADFNLGNIYNMMGNYESAKDHYSLSLKGAKKIQDNFLIASSYKSLAGLYKDEKNLIKANQYLIKALQYTSVQNIHLASEILSLKTVEFDIRVNLCELYIFKGDLEKALVNLLKIGEYIKTNKVSASQKSHYNYVYGKYYAQKKLYNNASAKFTKAIKLIEGDKKEVDYMLLSETYKQLSISLAKSGKDSDAFLNLLKHNSYKDKFLNEEKVRQDIIVKSKFLIEDYKNNAYQANEDRLLQLEIANRMKRLTLMVFIALLLLISSLIFVFVGYNTKRKLSSKLKLKNEQLEVIKDEALKSSELKTNFISNVSHELRTPLYGVVGITSLLLDNSNLNEQDRKHIKSLKYSGDYLLNLINDILQVGKMEAGNVELQNVSVNLKNLLQNIANSFEYRLEETNNKINILIDNTIPEIIRCDNVRLSQIIINLVGNSIKFTSNGNIDLRVKLVSLEGQKISLCFEIEDNGVGIPKDKFQSIFDNFSQLEDSNLNYQGTGLGLSITKNLIELFESKIELESEEGVGTKFSFEVSFDIDDSKTQEKTNTKSENGLKSLVNPNGVSYNILVAEDNKINQIVTKNLLKKQNYNCTIVNNGKEALYEVKNNTYDLILMDINMPIMNGNEATEIIREFNKNIPIIALTAADIEDVKENYLEIGYDEVIIKPFDNYEFYQTINAHIQKSENDKQELIKAS